MRTELKLDNGNVLVVFASIGDGMYIRHPGKANKDKLESLIAVNEYNNTITIDMEIAKAYGINIITKEDK